jgi:uncharacterized protein (TIGR03435 family)
MTNVPLSVYVKFGYQLETDKYSGPAWMDSQKFDLVAKVPDGATRDQLRQMIQVLLEDRFRLKFHYEKKAMPAYKLVKGGPKLKVASKEELAAPPPAPAGSSKLVLDRDGFPVIPDRRGMKMVLQKGTGRIRAYAQSAQELAGILSGQVGRPVIDGTGLVGKYDFTLAFVTTASQGPPVPMRGSEASTPENAPGVTIFGAVEQQLGLRLELTTRMPDVLIVDSATRVPTEN